MGSSFTCKLNPCCGDMRNCDPPPQYSDRYRDEPVALAPVASPAVAPVAVSVKDETAWLIERISEPMWWSLHYEPEPDWTRDANKAVRFARKEDADDYINDLGWTDAVATEHMWPAHRPHDWFEFKGMKCCRSCGNVWNATSDTRSCKGQVKVELRSSIIPATKGGEEPLDALHLTEYEIQVLLGCSISGCNMSPDRVFSLPMAWHRLHAVGLIDRTDGLAIITEKGRHIIATILAALAQDTDATPPSDTEEKVL